MKAALCAVAAAIFPAFSAAQNPVFARDVAPILYQHCSACHREGEAAPFPLLSYADAKRRAAAISKIVQSRAMPPWLPEPGYGDFAGVNRLTDSEIRLIADWAAAGAPFGHPADLPVQPHYTGGWQLGRPDLIVEASQTSPLAASGGEGEQNFVFTPPVNQPRCVRAFDVRAGDSRMVRHATLRVQSGQRPGENGGPHSSAAFDPEHGRFLFWKPGIAPYSEPEGLAWILRPGDHLVLTMLLRPAAEAGRIRPRIGLYFTDKPPTKFPVLLELEHDRALKIPGARDFTVSDDFKLPLDAGVLAVYPEARALGRLLEGYATLPGGTRKWLIRIPKWDETWGGVYRYREAVFLPKGTVISMRFHYDNSAGNVRNPNQPPKRIEAGDRPSGEVGHLWLQILPRAPGDHRRELQEAAAERRKERASR